MHPWNEKMVKKSAWLLFLIAIVYSVIVFIKLFFSDLADSIGPRTIGSLEYGLTLIFAFVLILNSAFLYGGEDEQFRKLFLEGTCILYYGIIKMFIYYNLFSNKFSLLLILLGIVIVFSRFNIIRFNKKNCI